MSKRWAEGDLPVVAGASRNGSTVPGIVRRAPNKQLEYLEQCAFIDWCEKQYFRHPVGDRSIEICLADCVEASLNGAFLQGDSKQRAIQWGKMKKAGAKKSANDLSINIPIGKYHGMKIEMKKQRRDYRYPSDLVRAIRPGQAEYLKLMSRLGHYTCFAYGWVDAAIHTCNYMKWDARAKGLC